MGSHSVTCHPAEVTFTPGVERRCGALPDYFGRLLRVCGHVVTDHVETGGFAVFQRVRKQRTVVAGDVVPLAVKVVRHYADEVQVPIAAPSATRTTINYYSLRISY